MNFDIVYSGRLVLSLGGYGCFNIILRLEAIIPFSDMPETLANPVTVNPDVG